MRPSAAALMKGADVLAKVRPGDRVCALTTHDHEVTGRATLVYPSHAVLDLGGQHGRAFVVTADNILSVTKRHAPEATRAHVRQAGRQSTPAAKEKS
jgi:hypothetical protein